MRGAQGGGEGGKGGKSGAGLNSLDSRFSLVIGCRDRATSFSARRSMDETARRQGDEATRREMNCFFHSIYGVRDLQYTVRIRALAPFITITISIFQQSPRHPPPVPSSKHPSRHLPPRIDLPCPSCQPRGRAVLWRAFLSS